MKDRRRELFILLNEGVKLEKIPTRLNINHKGEIQPAFLASIQLCHFLAQHHVDIAFIQETNSVPGYAQDLCLGYTAIVAPPSAFLFVPGVALLRHRFLCSGCIDLVHLDVHDQKMAVINCQNSIAANSIKQSLLWPYYKL
ncbi:hypothetical protein LAZ67_2003361 [Cordylochernes scorpioides]|uniref:Uncharacterized protein n=1 Tax=Cordylochernes scorpioides TaxID=51811 RepID=A0ABY6K2S5_9ARAC|nr:hypothetical protein LAZ67_2003361 [Cordylochernes scorpioides]